jgi:hypothetical protein
LSERSDSGTPEHVPTATFAYGVSGMAYRDFVPSGLVISLQCGAWGVS